MIACGLPDSHSVVGAGPIPWVCGGASRLDNVGSLATECSHARPHRPNRPDPWPGALQKQDWRVAKEARRHWQEAQVTSSVPEGGRSGASRSAGSLGEPARGYAVPMYPDNGILATVPGQFVAQASQGLPDAGTATEQEVSATVDADWAGVVTITYRRQLARHRKHSHWYWIAVRADPIAAEAPPSTTRAAAAPASTEPR